MKTLIIPYLVVGILISGCASAWHDNHCPVPETSIGDAVLIVATWPIIMAVVVVYSIALGVVESRCK